MAEVYRILKTTLDAIADAIRAKTGGSAAMAPEQMVTEIAAIPSGTTITDGIVVKARNANERMIIHCKETMGDGTVIYKDYVVDDPIPEDPETEEQQAEALTRYANSITSADDPDLISAAETLIEQRIKEE